MAVTATGGRKREKRRRISAEEAEDEGHTVFHSAKAPMATAPAPAAAPGTPDSQPLAVAQGPFPLQAINSTASISRSQSHPPSLSLSASRSSQNPPLPGQSPTNSSDSRDITRTHPGEAASSLDIDIALASLCARATNSPAHLMDQANQLLENPLMDVFVSVGESGEVKAIEQQ